MKEKKVFMTFIERDKERERRIIAVGAVFIFLAIATLGFCLSQIKISFVSVIGWFLFVAGLLLFLLANKWVSKEYRHYPQKRSQLATRMVISGGGIVLIASGFDNTEVVLALLRSSFVTFGIGWGVSGAYLLLRRNVNFFED